MTQKTNGLNGNQKLADRGQFIGKIGIRDAEQGIWVERYTGPVDNPFSTCTLFLERQNSDLFPLRLNNHLTQFLSGQSDYEYVNRKTGYKLLGFVEKPGVLAVRGSRGLIDSFEFTQNEVDEIFNAMGELEERCQKRLKEMKEQAEKPPAPPTNKEANGIIAGTIPSNTADQTATK